jgi:hypothetical protein
MVSRIRIGELGRPVDIGQPDGDRAAIDLAQQPVDGQIRGEIVLCTASCNRIRRPSRVPISE